MRAEFCIFESNAPGLKANFYEPYVDMPSGEYPVMLVCVCAWGRVRGRPILLIDAFVATC